MREQTNCHFNVISALVLGRRRRKEQQGIETGLSYVRGILIWHRDRIVTRHNDSDLYAGHSTFEYRQGHCLS
jgi:hypothetical protein